MIGILASDNIADLKPLGDRLLVEVSSCSLHVQPDWGIPGLSVSRIRSFPSCRTHDKCFMMATVPSSPADQVEEGKDETEGGLLLTSTTKEQPTIGKARPDRASHRSCFLSSGCQGAASNTCQ